MTTVVQTLFPKQIAFIQATETEVLICGGSGSGKTRALCYKILTLASVPRARVGLARKANSSLANSTLVTLRDILGSVYGSSGAHWIENKTEQWIEIVGGGRILYFGCDDESKLGSKEMSACGVDEATELDEKDWGKILSLCRIKVEGNQIFGACNPDSPDHWLARRFNIPPETFIGDHKASDEQRAFMMRATENPTLSPAFFKALETLPKHQRKRLLEGVWSAAQGLVYPDFDRGLHVRSRPSGWKKVYVAVDDGTTSAEPMVAIRFGVDSSGNVHAEREVTSRDMYSPRVRDRAARIAKLCKDGSGKVDIETIIIDPSASNLFSELNSLGLPVRKSAQSTIEEGISAVTERLFVDQDNNPGLTVDPSCKTLVKEFHSYIRSSGGNGEPVDRHNHALDALRYLCLYLRRPSAVFIGYADEPVQRLDDDGKPIEKKEETVAEYYNRMRQNPDFGF